MNQVEYKIREHHQEGVMNHPEAHSSHLEALSHQEGVMNHQEALSHQEGVMNHPEALSHPEANSSHPEALSHPEANSSHPEALSHPEAHSHPEVDSGLKVYRVINSCHISFTQNEAEYDTYTSISYNTTYEGVKTYYHYQIYINKGDFIHLPVDIFSYRSFFIENIKINNKNYSDISNLSINNISTLRSNYARIFLEDVSISWYRNNNIDKLLD
jgi:hypothetical protein